VERSFYESPHWETVAVPALSVETGRIVLVVDNHPNVLEIVSITLKDLGYHVFEASGPEEALSLLGTNKVDVLLTGIVFPEPMNGWALSQEARRRHSGMAALLMTAHRIEKVRDDFAIPPDVPILAKPFTREQLLQALAKVLKLRDKGRDEPG